MDCLSSGISLKKVLKESVSFSFPNSASFKIAVAVNCFVFDPMSKMVFGLLRVSAFLLASP